jgi:hypothetical protein
LAESLMALCGGEGGKFLLAWWEDKEAWRSAPPEVLAALARKTAGILPTSLFETSKIMPPEVMAMIETGCKDVDGMSAQSMEDLVRTYLALDRLPEAKRWTERAIARILSKPEELTLDLAYRYAQLALETGATGSSEAWAAAYRDLIRRGSFNPMAHQEKIFAGTIRDPSGIKGLEKFLIDDKGALRLGVGKVLSNAHMMAGDFQEWRKSMEDQAKAEREDRQVSWKLLDAYTRSVEAREGGMEQHQRIAFILKAKESVRGPEEALSVLEERINVLREAYKFDLAISLIHESRKEFGPALSVRLDGLEESLKKELGGHELAMARQKARNADITRASKLEFFRNCAQRAKEAGNQEDLQRLERMIADLEAERGGIAAQ